MVYNCRCLTIKFIVTAWLSLVSVTSVLAATISFERKANEDIFKNNGEKCNKMKASFYESGWCKCDHGQIFVGNKCMFKSEMSGKSNLSF